MENEDEEQLCMNCKKYVSSANFAIHSAFCERYIYVCKICKESVQISEKDKHLEEYHVAFLCDLCGAPLEKWLLPKHLESCPKRRIACEYCEADFPFDEHFEHVEFCGSRTEKCLLCQKYVMIKEKAKHDEIHRLSKQYQSKSIEEEIKQNKVNEVISKTSTEGKISEKASKTKHDNLTSERGAVSRIASKLRDGADASFLDRSKSMIGTEQNLEISAAEGATASLTEKRKEYSKHYTKCHVCKQDIPWIDFNTHVPACASSAGKCSVCGEDVPNYAIKEHMKEHIHSRFQRPSCEVPENFVSYHKSVSGSDDENYAAKSKVNDAVIGCPYCSQKCSKDRISEHIRECPNNVYKCQLCYEIVPEKDKSRHETYECRMLQDTDELSEPRFSRNSSQISFECPLCNEDIPEENREKHLSFECKKLFSSNETHNFYNIGGDSLNSYECPYCGAKMPEKDKAKHQSHECIALIQNSGVDHCEPDSYAEVAKKPCKRNCKCHHKFETCPSCEKRIPVHEMSEHGGNCQQGKFPCLHCEELIEPAYEEIHLQRCPAMASYTKSTDLNSGVVQNSRSSNYEQKGAKPKTTDIREMMTPRSARCKYCQTSLNADIVKYHENECLYKPIQCNKCFNEVMLKDYKSHKCKGKKGKGKNQTVYQQTTGQEDKPGFWKRFTKNFTGTDENEEGKREYMSIQTQNYYAGQRHVSGDFGNTEYRNFAELEDTLLPCEFCQKIFPASELVLHMTGCQPDLVSYAKPDSYEDSKQIKSRSGEECALLSTKLSSVNNDTVPTSRSKNIQSTTMLSPFFSGKSASSAKYKRREHSEESNVEPGEFLTLFKSSSRHHEYPESTENGVEGKRAEHLHFEFFQNAENSDNHRAENDYSKQISNHSDAEMDVDQTENTIFKKANITAELEELDRQVSEKLCLDDSEMIDMLNFMKGKDGTESDEEYAIHSDENGEKVESKNFKKEVYSVSDDTQEYQGDLPVSKKKTIDEKVNRENLNLIDNKVQNQKEHTKRLLANFRFGAYKSENEDNAHSSVQSKAVYEESDKLCKLKSYKCSESTEDQTELTSSYRQRLYFKHGRYDLPVDDDVLSERNDEPEIKSKEKAAEHFDNSRCQRQYPYSWKYAADFKHCTYESAVFSDEVKVHCPVPSEKYDKTPEKPYVQKNQKSSLNIEEEKQYRNRCLANFKFSTHVPALSDEENEHHGILSGKGRKDREKLCKQKTSTYSDNTMDKKDHLRNFKEHLPDFKYGIRETQSAFLVDDMHTIPSPEKKNGCHGKSAFKIEPVESQLKEIKHPSHPAMMKKGKASEELDERIAKLQRGFVPEDDDDVTKWKKWREHSDAFGSD